MTELTPEERQKIYAEEKARIEAQEQIKAELSKKKKNSGCLTFFLWIIGILFWYIALPIYLVKRFKSKCAVIDGDATLSDNEKEQRKKQKKTKYWLVGGSIYIVMLIGLLGDRDSTRSSDYSSSAGTGSPEVETFVPVSPPLELKSYNWYEGYGYAIVEGQVKNTSSDSLRNVEAVASFYTKSGEFITTDDALIEYNPVLPGQTSPFKVMARWNPEMAKASVEFKELGGGTIEYKDSTSR